MKVSVFVCLAFWISSCQEDLEIIANPSYSIGLVGSFSPGGQTRSVIDFDFTVKNQTLIVVYGNGDHRWNVPSCCIHHGDKYMVQYDSLNPSKARMLFSYPVHDSTDYKNDILLFKKTPPGYPSP